jgi:hypothetical protein
MNMNEILEKLSDNSKVSYQAGHILLTALSKLEEDLKHNYENGSVQQKALSRIAGLQGDLFSSYLILLWQGPLIGRSIILRSLLENEGNLLHVKNDEKRSQAYIDYTDKLKTRVRNRVNNKVSNKADYGWDTESNVEQRVKLFPDKNVLNVYDWLSDFVHGNNLQDFMDTKELTDTYIKVIDSYFVAVFIDFMSELGISLNMSDEKRDLVFKSIKEAAQLKK